MPSSVVASYKYDALTSTLSINFVSGMVYDYQQVPEQVYLEMKASGAKGIYFNQNIKGKYSFKKVS